MEKLYLDKENAAKELECKYYIHLSGDDLMVYTFKEKNGNGVVFGKLEPEYVITKENYLICVTANSCETIRNEVKKAIGFIGTIKSLIYTDVYEQII